MDAVALEPGSVGWQPELPGAEYAILSGDPGAAGGAYVIRFRTSKRIEVPAHWHPEDEHITVLAGVFALGFGERFDTGGLRKYEAGSYLAVPKQMRHFALYEDGTVVQVHGVGPFQSIYVNPDEDLGDRIPAAGG